MKQFDILIRSVIFIIAFVGIFYIVPKIIIPDVIQEFKKVFGKQPGQRIEMTTYKKKKKLWDTRSTIDIKM
jgi:hypothetical protein